MYMYVFNRHYTLELALIDSKLLENLLLVIDIFISASKTSVHFDHFFSILQCRFCDHNQNHQIAYFIFGPCIVPHFAAILYLYHNELSKI